jgi:hypothetical protein
MAGLYDGMDIVPAAAQPAPPPFPKAPIPSLYDGLEEAPKSAQMGPVAAPPREAKGFVESVQAGFQGSAPGLAWRRRLPELISNPEHASWWERAATGITQVVSELPLMIGGAIAGAPVGGSAGGAVAGPPGAAAGALLGAGFGMGAVPGAIRTAYMESLKAGEVKDAGDFWNILREVAIAATKEGAINAAAMGAGAIAGRVLGSAIAPAIGTKMSVGTATTAIEATDIATQIALMPTIPAVLAGRLPAAHEFLDAAILIGGLKTAHVTAQNIAAVYARTGKTPAEQVADAQGNPKVAQELATAAPEAPKPEVVIPRTADGRVDMPTIQDALFAETARIDELALREKDLATPLTDAERVELEATRAKVATLEAQLAAGAEAATRPVDAAPRYASEQLASAREQAIARIAELDAKVAEAALTDTERAQRVFLKNSLDKPEALAMHFKIEPTGGRVPTAVEREASAQRVYDDVREQVRAADEARRGAGLEPLGEAHADAVAALVRARVRTRAARLGRLPEEIYNERPLQIRDETAAEVVADPAIAAAAAREGDPITTPEVPAGPELDLFGEPITPPVNERMAVADLATQEIPLANLVLSKEVPQFKNAADAQGVVTALGGKFDRTGVGPIQVWERLDGTLEVISGRHRLDLARRSGEETIPAQVHREADGFDARQAATLDAQLNIREEQGSVADYAQYFKDAGISKEAAEQRGLLARNKGRTGFAIARDASPDVLQAHRAGKLTDEAALAISSAAPGSDRLQALGMMQVQEGKSILFAVNTMRAVDLMAAERMAGGEQGDIFGFDDSAMKEAATMAKRASSKQRAIAEQIAAVNGASKRPELARKMGVDVQDPEGIQKKIAELRQEQYLWDNWPLYPELVAKLRELNQDPMKERSPDARDWRDAPIDEAEYFNDRDIYDLEANPYIDKAGFVVASSRTTPNPNTFPPVGSWRISALNGSYGREIEQLVELPIAKLRLTELDSAGKLDPVKRGDDERYAEWLKEGKRPPPIQVVQTDRGTLNVTDGHRRALAAKLAGKDTIEAWVNYAVPTPSGSRINSDPTKPFIRTGMTYEMLMGETPNRFLDRIPLEGFDGRPETPAEHQARDAEAAAAAMRKEQPPEDMLFQSKPETWWYSALARNVDTANMKAAPAQGWKDWLKGQTGKGAIKAEEIKWSGLEEWLDLQDGVPKEMAQATDKIDPISGKTVWELQPNPAYGKVKVTKEAVAAYLKAGGVKVDEKMLGGIDFDASWNEGKEEAARYGITGDIFNNTWGKRMNWRAESEGEQYPYSDTDVGRKLREIIEPLARIKRGEPRHPEDREVLADTKLLREHGLEPTEDPGFADMGRGTRWGLMDDEAGDIYVDPADMPADAYPDNVRAAAGRVLLYLDHDTKSGERIPTKFSAYQLPGGKNYRELLLTLPATDPNQGIWKQVEALNDRMADINLAQEDFNRLSDEKQALLDSMNKVNAELFRSSHFDTPNILAHVRFNERTDAEGKRVLFVEEFQSDWAQQGRTKGFSGAVNAFRARMEGKYGADWVPKMTEAEMNEYTDLRNGPSDGPPAAPFVTKTDSRLQLAVKRMVAYAAENGFERIAWTRGEQQVERYTNALRKQVDVIEWKKTPEGVHLVGYKGGGGPSKEAIRDLEIKVSTNAKLVDERLVDVGDATNGDYRQLLGEPKEYTGTNPDTDVDIPDGMTELSYLNGAGLILRGADGKYEVATGNHDSKVFDADKLADAERHLFYKWVALEQPDAVLQNPDLPPALRQRMELYDSVRTAWYRQHQELVQLRKNARVRGQGHKVVDTTEKETALSDAIGKAMAEKIIGDDAQTGTIEGDGIKIDDTGMAGFYDRILPGVAKDVLKKLGGGKVGTTQLDTGPGKGSNPDAVPMLEPISDSTWQGLQGAEPFIGIGRPLYTETRIRTTNFDTDETSVNTFGVVVDPHGIAFVDELGGEYRASWDDVGQPAPRNGGQAVVAFYEAWESGRIMRALEKNDPDNNEFAAVGKDGEPIRGEHQAFDITPELREKALQGLPLFQDPASPRASYQIAANLITTMQGADKTSVVHELGHSWLEEAKADAARPDAPLQIKADWDIIRAELAIPEDGKISRESHEQWARTVERYLAEGEAPSVELRGVFERFKAWMLEIYESLGNLKANVTPELKGVLDRMLAVDEEIAAAREMDVPRAYLPEAMAATAEAIIPPPAARRKIEPGFKAEQAQMEPFADALPPGPGEAPDNIHVNYAYINSPIDVKLAMQRMAEIDQANIQKQRGGTDGVKSWAEANAEQAKYLNDILGGSDDTLKLFEPRDPDAPHVDVRLGILKKLAVGAAADSARLRDIVLEKGHDATVREQLEYLGSIERARMIQAEFLGERASVARALNALKDTTEGSGEIGRMLEAIGLGEEGVLHQAARTPAEEQAYLKQKLEEILLNYKGKTPLDIAKLHKEIGTLKGTFKLAKEIERASTWEMIVEGWKSALLSGPVTHTTNLFGTGAFHIMRAPVDALAAMIGMARGASPGMGESNRASMSEAIARLTGMLGGMQDGLKLAYHTFNLDDPTGKTESYRTAIPGRTGDIIRIPLRLMGAEDALISTMYKRGELHTLAIRQAFDEGGNPSTREFAERVTRLLDSPTPEMEAAAEAAATRMTFNMPLGEKGAALQRFVQTWNLQWMLPFIRTPINIFKELMRMSPFAPAIAEWRADIRKGGAYRDKAIAEIAIGAGVMTTTMAYAFAGNISGNGSPDPGKNRAKVGTWQPYSVLIGDTWYEYARIQPTGTLMGMAADISLVWDHMNEEEKDKVPKLLAAAFANAVTNQTFLQGITNVVNAVSDPVRFGPRFLQGFAQTAVPNIIGQPTAMADPVVREVNGMLEAIQSRIPGARQELLPKRDWLGEPVKTKERFGIVMPIREQKVTEDKVRLEAAKLELSMAAAPRKTHIGKGTGKLGDVKLEPGERDVFAKVGGEFAHKILTNIVNAPGYDEMPNLVKRKIFAQVLSASHRIAAVAAMPPEKRVAYLQSISEKVATELTPGDAP